MAGSRLADRARIRRRRPAQIRPSTARDASARWRRRSRRSKSCTCWQAGARLGTTTSTSACASRLRADGKRAGVPWLGMSIAELSKLDARARHRLVPAQGPSAVRAAPAPGGEERRADLTCCTSVDDDWLMPVASKIVVAPSAGCVAGRRRRRHVAAKAALQPVDGTSRDAAHASRSARARRAQAILLGNAPRSIRRRRAAALAHWIAEQTGASFGFLARRPTRSAATSSARCRAPTAERRQMLAEPRKAYRPAQRRAGARLRRSAGSASRRCAAPSSSCADVAVQDRPGLRRRAAADRAVHRNRRHLRQLRRPRAELQRRACKPLGETRPAGRCCACWATCSACRASSSTRRKQVRECCAWAARTLSALALEQRSAPLAAPRRVRQRRSSASPTCRSTSPIRSCAARRRCSRPPTRGAAAWMPRALRAARRRRRRRGARAAQGAAAVLAARSTRRCRRRGARRRRASAHARARRHVRHVTVEKAAVEQVPDSSCSTSATGVGPGLGASGRWSGPWCKIVADRGCR